jgi:hypothetical protein
MNSKHTNRILTPIFLVFALVNIGVYALKNNLQQIQVHYTVVMAANCIIALLTAIIVLLQKKAATNTNPHVFNRSVMGGTFIKLMVLGGITVVYLLVAKEQRNIGGIIAGMLLYIVYTVVEVRITLLLNKK